MQLSNNKINKTVTTKLNQIYPERSLTQDVHGRLTFALDHNRSWKIQEIINESGEDYEYDNELNADEFFEEFYAESDDVANDDNLAHSPEYFTQDIANSEDGQSLNNVSFSSEDSDTSHTAASSSGMFTSPEGPLPYEPFQNSDAFWVDNGKMSVQSDRRLDDYDDAISSSTSSSASSSSDSESENSNENTDNDMDTRDGNYDPITISASEVRPEPVVNHVLIQCKGKRNRQIDNEAPPLIQGKRVRVPSQKVTENIALDISFLN